MSEEKKHPMAYLREAANDQLSQIVWHAEKLDIHEKMMTSDPRRHRLYATMALMPLYEKRADDVRL